jgi:hypothetical protein
VDFPPSLPAHLRPASMYCSEQTGTQNMRHWVHLCVKDITRRTRRQHVRLVRILATGSSVDTKQSVYRSRTYYGCKRFTFSCTLVCERRREERWVRSMIRPQHVQQRLSHSVRTPANLRMSSIHHIHDPDSQIQLHCLLVALASLPTSVS